LLKGYYGEERIESQKPIQTSIVMIKKKFLPMLRSQLLQV